jgi:hypothetical protein
MRADALNSIRTRKAGVDTLIIAEHPMEKLQSQASMVFG